MKKWIAGFFMILLLGMLWYTWYRFRDRHPGYQVDIHHTTTAAAISAGFAKVSINPVLPDSWVDINGDARYRPEDGDTYEDLNNNGKFDPIWIAGFHNQRAAQGIHDTLWARTVLLEQEGFKIALCAIDAIGFGSDDIIDVRKKAKALIDIDYIVVTSTHSHQTPDLLGMWGRSDFSSGVNAEYLTSVKDRCVVSILAADKDARPAIVRYAEDLSIAETLVEDSRKPTVLDPGLRILHFSEASSGHSLGTIVGWANHPETLWSKNTLLSSDFPHYLRESLERGIYQEDSLWFPGLGGTTVFVNGAIGGLMTSSPRSGIMSLRGDTTYLEPSLDKAKAQGETLAFFALQMLADTNIKNESLLPLEVIARSVKLPMHNQLFKLANWLGVLDRGMVGWFTIRSEIAYWRLGEVGFLHMPGEVYPELVNGGVEAPVGQDFAIDPIEVPSWRDILPAKYNFVVGLSNDMIGYIIPKSEWDEDEPYLYEADHSPYGEVNSLGPETAPLLHEAVMEMMEQWKTSNSQ